MLFVLFQWHRSGYTLFIVPSKGQGWSRSDRGMITELARMFSNLNLVKSDIFLETISRRCPTKRVEVVSN